MLKYCLVNRGFAPRPELPSGVEQWVVALGGELVEPETLAAVGACAGYDLIHVVYCPLNDSLVAHIRRQLGGGSSTQLLLSLRSIYDTPPDQHDEDTLRTACGQADMLIASDPDTAKYYEQRMGRPVHALPHPADLGQCRNAASAETDKLDSIAFVMSHVRFGELDRECVVLAVLKRAPCLEGRDIDVFGDNFGSDTALLHRLSRYAFICFDADLRGHDAELIYLATRGCAILGGGRAEVVKRCYALTAHLPFEQTLKSLMWLLSDPSAHNFALESAADKLDYYNHGNSRDRLLNVWAATGGAAGEPAAVFPRSAAPGGVVYLDEIERVSGPAHRAYGDNEFVVVCLVKNGAEYLPSFLRHYRAMGARHFYFIDNESGDATCAILAQQADVTTYRTALKHKKFESEIRRVIIEKHCRSRWCLCVDIDELFEFPGVGAIGVHGFLNYLNANRFTAVVAYMVDMFALESGAAGPYLEDDYPYFDLSNVTHGDYFVGFEPFCDRNVLPDPAIGNFYGGVRQHHIPCGESKFLLTKHPLVFIDHQIEAVTMPHFCNHARVADVTCLLKHYKLTASLKERIEEGVRADTFSFIIKDQIAAYFSLLGSGTVYARAGTTEMYADVEQFVQNGFLQVPERYRNYMTRLVHVAGAQRSTGR